MTFDFQYASPEKIDRRSLQQGDILVREAGLKAALAHAHSYYAEAESYTHFMVLTQSCDLIRRNGKSKSRYITLAAARPLGILVDRIVKKHSFSDPQFPVELCRAEQEIAVRQTLERLLHNTENGYFFLKAGSHQSIDTDLVVFLPLSVALRLEHYDACLGAKVAQLTDVFQAKVGWLAGNLYSRVGTPDLEEAYPEKAEQIKEEFVSRILEQTAWLTPAQRKVLKRLHSDWRRGNPGRVLDTATALTLIAAIPTPSDIVIKRAVEVLALEDMLREGPDAVERAKNVLSSDQALAKYLGELTRSHSQ